MSDDSVGRSGHEFSILMRTGDSLPDERPPGFDEATAVLADQLEGIDTANAFVPPEPHTGFCRICGKHIELSFEHIPPRAAGNSVRAKVVPAIDVLASNEPVTFPHRGWTPAQRGAGGYVLCESCNRVAGHRYVKPYAAFAKAVKEGIDAHYDQVGHLPGTLDLGVEGWELGDIARQGLVALMDVGIHSRLILRYPGLSDVVLDGEGELPEGLRLGLAVALGSNARHSAPVAVADAGGVSVFSEVALSPFSWTLGFVGGDLQPLQRTADVSHWLKYKRKEQAEAQTIGIPLGFIHSAIPGDYRPITDIDLG